MKKSKVLYISAFIFLIIVTIALFSPWLSKYPHNIPSGDSLMAPCKSHILGTDDLGIDIWAQLCFGARISLFIGIATATISAFIGSLVGIVSAYYGGLVDKILMRLTDMMLSIPSLPMMIVLGAFFGPSLKNIIVVLALFSWTNFARIVRSKTMPIMKQQYIVVARSFGGKFSYLVLRHILPQIMPIIFVSFIRIVGRSVVAESSLSFLGLGDPTSKSWGLVLYYAMSFDGIYFTPYWKWWILSPLIFIITFVVSIAFIVKEFEGKLKIKN